MEKLIDIHPTTINNKSIESCSARDLYFKLGLNKSHWNRWNTQNIVENEFFQEHKDWIGFATMASGNEIKDFMISLDMAKHLAMMAKTEHSHQIREYFIECEKKTQVIPHFNLPQTYKEALQALVIEVDKSERLALENHTLRPKGEFYDAVTGSSDTIDMASVCKVLNLKGLGRTKLFAFLRIKGVLNQQNKPYQLYLDRGYCRMITSSYQTPDGGEHINLKTVWFSKGVDFIRKLVANNPETLAELENN
jgi:anti-repressor protein